MVRLSSEARYISRVIGRKQPLLIRRLNVKDRRPLSFEGRWLWHPTPADETTDAQYDYLPCDVFDRLEGFIPRDNPLVSKVVKAYRARDEAMTALIRATEPTPPATDPEV